jgi:hypothetical protein
MDINDLIGKTKEEKELTPSIKYLNDIEDNTNIEIDYTFFYILNFSFILISLIIFIFIKIIKKYLNKEVKYKKEYINLLSINFKNTKNSIYLFSENISYFKNEVNKEQLIKINNNIEKYKYIKEEIPMDKNDIILIKQIIKQIKKR